MIYLFCPRRAVFPALFMCRYWSCESTGFHKLPLIILTLGRQVGWVSHLRAGPYDVQ